MLHGFYRHDCSQTKTSRNACVFKRRVVGLWSRLAEGQMQMVEGSLGNRLGNPWHPYPHPHEKQPQCLLPARNPGTRADGEEARGLEAPFWP